MVSFMEKIRKELVEKLNDFETYFVVDSMPLFAKWLVLREEKSLRRQIILFPTKDVAPPQT